MRSTKHHQHTTTRSTLTVSRNAQELVGLVTKSQTVLTAFAKAKTAKLGALRSSPVPSPRRRHHN